MSPWNVLLQVFLLLGNVQLFTVVAEEKESKQHMYMCPGETLSLECTVLNVLKTQGVKIKDIKWRIKSAKWTDVAYCNTSLKCILEQSKEFDQDGVSVTGISKGTLTIKRSMRENGNNNLTFMCSVDYDKRKVKGHLVNINLKTECIWTKEGADVNLTDHLINMVRPWKQVQDLDIKIGRREKLAYCSGTRGNCTLAATNHSRSGFRDRLKLKDGSILLTGIHPGDDGLKMKIDVHWRGGGRRRRRSVGGKHVRHFTLKIRLRAPRGNTTKNIASTTDKATSVFNQTIITTESPQLFESAPTVQTEAGEIVGNIETVPLGKAVFTYLGIPYAEPPVGELRFAAPKQAKRWSGVRQATAYGAACPQPDFAIPNVSAGEENEDCLYLNVFVPAPTLKPGENAKAVMVWIQGHNFTLGSSVQYPAHVLASFNDVIVVTFNYRIGILGFLNIPGTDFKGNYGMHDQVMVLDWVKKNIASFGGDPRKVTIFGEGAGGMSVSLHLISPLSKGLFHRAIMQSGSATSPLLTGNVASNKTLKELQNIANCKSDVDLTHCLRSKSPEEIISFQENLSLSVSTEITTPVPDKSFLLEVPRKLFEKPKRQFPDRSVDVIIGLTTHEGALDLVLKSGNRTQVNRDVFESTIKRKLGLGQNKDRHRGKVIEELVKHQYTAHGDPNNTTTIRKLMMEFESDFMFLAPAMFEAKELAKRVNRAYFYVFEHRPDFSSFPSWAGAVHGVDVPYVFGAPFKQISSLVDFFTPRFSEVEKGFSLYIMKLWTDFAKFGSPTPPGSNSSPVKWHPFTEEKQFYMGLDVTPRLKQRYRSSQVAFWNNLITKISKRGRRGKMTKKPTK